MKTKAFIIIGLFALISIVLLIGLKNPPSVLMTKEIPEIVGIYTQNGSLIKFSDSEITYWRNLKFTIANDDYPGETPEYIVSLAGKDDKFTAIYNKNGEFIFFSFAPKIEYGFLCKPAPGGWTKPLYKVKANDNILKLLKIK